MNPKPAPIPPPRVGTGKAQPKPAREADLVELIDQRKADQQAAEDARKGKEKS